MVVVVIGLPGTGKTTFSRALAQKIDAVHLNTDILRDHLHLRGKYDRQTKEFIYKQLEKETEAAILAGKKVVVDGTFYKQSLRQAYTNLATKHNTPIHWIEIKAPEACIRARVEKKRTYSEADFQVYLKVKSRYEPMVEDHLQVWNNDPGSMDVCLREAIQYLEMPQNEQE